MLRFLLLAVAATTTVVGAPTSDHRSPHQAPLKPCSWQSRSECLCPNNTVFVNSTTTAVVGASALDVAAVAGNWSSTDWAGSHVVSSSGSGNRVGSTRTYLSEGVAFVEILDKYTLERDGSLTQKYGMQTFPITYNLTGGLETFAGEWDTFSTKAIGKYQTAVTWNIWSCFPAGTPFGALHETSINNLTTILRGQGKLKGKSVAPTSNTP